LTPFDACCYGAKPMPQKSRRYLLWFLVLLAAAFLLYKFRHGIAPGGFRWAVVGQSLRETRLSLLLLATVAIYACYAIRSLRWMRFCRSIGPTRFGNVYSATLMGFACIFLLGRAGEPVRPVLIARKDKLPVSGMFGVYVLERVFDMAAAAVLAGLALLFFERGGFAGAENSLFMKMARSTAAALFVGLAGVIAFLVYFRYHGGGWLSRKLQHESWRTGWREKIAVLLEGFSEGLQGIRGWSDLAALVGYSAVHWTLIVVVYLWVAHAFGGELASLTLGGAGVIVAFTMVGSAAQAPTVGGGAQLAMALVLTKIFGVETERAVAASIVTWLVTFASCSLVGVPLLLREGWTMGELRRMAREEEKAGEAALLPTAVKSATEPTAPSGEKPR